MRLVLLGGVKADEAKADGVTAQTFPTSNYSYTLITSQDDIVVGTKVVIASKDSAKAMGDQGGNNRGEVSITLNQEKTEITGWTGTSPAVFELTEGTKTNETTYGFKDLSTGEAGNYLYAASSGSNYLRSQSTNDDNGSFTISVASTGIATIQAKGTNTRNLLKYNSSNKLFSCYGSGQQSVYLYKVEATTSSYTVDFVTNCGQTVASQQVAIGGKVTEPTGLTKEGYEIYQWTTDEKWFEPWDFNTVVTGDMTLYADWVNEEMDICTLTFDLNGMGGTTPTTQEIFTEHYFAEVTNPVKSSDSLYEYTFDGWYEKDGEGNFLEDAFDFDATYSEDKTVYAKWTRGDYLIKTTFKDNKTVANLSFSYDSETIPGSSGDAVWPNNGNSAWTAVSDGVTINPSSFRDPGCRINSGATFTVSCQDGITEIRFSSNADENKEYGLGNLNLKTGEPGTLTKSGKTAIWSGNSVTSVTFKTSAQVRLDGLVVTHGAGDVTNYSNFGNVKMQFRYDLSTSTGPQRTKYNNAKAAATETGLFITDDENFAFDVRDNLDVAAGKVGKKYVNEETDQEVSNYTVGIKIPESHYTTTLHAASYILMPDGNYYWNAKKDVSVLSMLTNYSTNQSVSDEGKAVCAAFASYINSLNA